MSIDLINLKKYAAIIGCDEVGRGPIAGPVNACAVKIDESNLELINLMKKLNVTDSKKLTTKKREIILFELGIVTSKIKLNRVYHKKYKNHSYRFCVTEHTHLDIDQMNILQASLSAMKKASDKLVTKKDIVLIDGNKTFASIADVEAIVKGDSKSIAIGLASIIAKNFRDEKMYHYDLKYPGYNLGKHAGYPTKEHRDAIKKLGITEIHRKTFKGVKEYI